MILSFNDSSWDVGNQNSFPPFLHERYYRTAVVLKPSVLSTYASFECFISHLFSVEVFINGIHFLTHNANANQANTSIETVKREGLHRYFQSSWNVVAIHVYCDLNQDLCKNITSDPFTAHFVFFSFDTPTSNNMKLRSLHDMDFYAHPLVSAFDDSRVSEWWFRGRTADVFIEYSNPLYESVRTGCNLLEESSSMNTPLSRVRKTRPQTSLRGNSMDPRIRSTMTYWTPRRIFYSAIETSVSHSR